MVLRLKDPVLGLSSSGTPLQLGRNGAGLASTRIIKAIIPLSTLLLDPHPPLSHFFFPFLLLRAS